MRKIKLLYDGWPLIYAKNSAAAIHLRTLLHFKPDNVQAILALPAAGDHEIVDASIELLVQEENDLGKWQQGILPKLARSSGAELIHSTISGASLFGRQKTLISPTGWQENTEGGSRLLSALGQGGLIRAEILLPDDVVTNNISGRAHSMPPIAHPDFFGEASEIDPAPEVPDSYLLYHGPAHAKAINDLLEAWSWAAASIGDLFPLVMLGLNAESNKMMEEKIKDNHMEEYIILLPELSWADLVNIYKASSAVIIADQEISWGSSARLALAAGKSMVGIKNAANDKLLGPAAYLVEKGDLRSFGAAMITIVVDESVWEKMEESANHHSAKWDARSFSDQLEKIYTSLI
jgi:glycosyltransferase involved in cell wall biosynthesis